MAGFMWPPLTGPRAWAIVPMARPKASEICRMVGSADGHLRAEPRPKKTRMRVARNSANTALRKAAEHTSFFMVSRQQPPQGSHVGAAV